MNISLHSPFAFILQSYSALTCINLYSFARDRPRFTDNLDVIKFLCKDLWTVLFKKQVDNLKTNHRVCAIQKQLCRGDAT